MYQIHYYTVLSQYSTVASTPYGVVVSVILGNYCDWRLYFLGTSLQYRLLQ